LGFSQAQVNTFVLEFKKNGGYDIIEDEKNGLFFNAEYSIFRMNKNGKEAINGFAQGDEQRMMLLGLKRFTKTEPFNTKDARRNVAAVLVDANKYCF
jgi:hypothetical protein